MDKHPTYLYYEPGNPVVKLFYCVDFPAKEMEAAWNSKSVYVCICIIIDVDGFLSHVNDAYGFIHELYLFTRWTFHFKWTYSRSYHRHLILQVAFPPVSFNKSRTLDDFRINVQCNGIVNTTGIKITNNFVKGILARKNYSMSLSWLLFVDKHAKCIET